MFKKKNGQKGFTLIELLIVVAILGILAAVIIPNVNGFLVTGRLNAANTEAENVKTAALAYQAETGNPPSKATPDLSDYINGNLKANYFFNTAGFITDVGDASAASPAAAHTAAGWSGIKWDVSAAAGSMKWIK